MEYKNGSNGVRISNKEIFNELRSVHTKLDVLTTRFESAFANSKTRGERIEKLESRVETFDRKLAFIAGGAALFGSIVPYLLGRMFSI